MSHWTFDEQLIIDKLTKSSFVSQAVGKFNPIALDHLFKVNVIQRHGSDPIRYSLTRKFHQEMKEEQEGRKQVAIREAKQKQLLLCQEKIEEKLLEFLRNNTANGFVSEDNEVNIGFFDSILKKLKISINYNELISILQKLSSSNQYIRYQLNNKKYYLLYYSLNLGDAVFYAKKVIIYHVEKNSEQFVDENGKVNYCLHDAERIQHYSYMWFRKSVIRRALDEIHEDREKRHLIYDDVEEKDLMSLEEAQRHCLYIMNRTQFNVTSSWEYEEIIQNDPGMYFRKKVIRSCC